MKTKTEYHKRIENQLRDWEEKITMLKGETERKQAKGRFKYLEGIEELKQEKARIQEDLDRLKRASGKAWVNIKREIEKALGELKSSFQSIALQVIELKPATARLMVHQWQGRGSTPLS